MNDLVDRVHLVETVAGLPLSADVTEEVIPRLADGTSLGKQVIRYRVYRDGRGRVSLVSHESTQGPEPLVIVDPAGSITFFDGVSRIGYRILLPAPLERNSIGIPPAVGSQLSGVTGKRGSNLEDLGPATVNGTECKHSRVTIWVQNDPASRNVDERCVSRDLGVVLEYKTSGPKGDAHSIVDRIQREEPPPEFFSAPSGYSIVNANAPVEDTPPRSGSAISLW